MNIDEILRKIRGLQNLANDKKGATPEEAASAAAMAQRLIDKYQINIEDVDYDANQAKADAEPITNFGYSDPLDQPKRTYYEDNWSVRLASIVSKMNGCVTHYQRTAKEYSSIRIIGQPSDVAAVRYLYAFFKQQILNLRAENCVGRSNQYKGHFAEGCVDTLKEKLEASRRQTYDEKLAEVAGNPLALARVQNAIAKVDKKLEAIEDFENQWWYDTIASAIAISKEQAKLLAKYRRDELKALVGEEDFKKIMKRWDDWREEQARLAAKSGRGGGGRSGFKGQGSSGETGREHGQRAGQAIRLTGAKASIG
jgi:hypothetical protein